MKQFIYFRFPFLIIFSMLIFSCASRKDMAYYQNIDSVINGESKGNFDPALEVDDLLRIIVLAENPEIAAPFNMNHLDPGSGIAAAGQETNTYLIDSEGFIQFPIIGKIKLGGLTKSQATTELNSVLREYLKKPSVNITILNYKVTVQGEVARPGVFNIQSERLTLPEALSMAGDLTIYGKRNNIMVIREKAGKKSVERVDITKADFVNSPYYYLSQNDLVYVEPNSARINASVIGPNIGLILSVASFLVTIIVLITK